MVRFRSRNTNTILIIIILVVVVAFFLLDGGTWIKGTGHGNMSASMANLQWTQILISMSIGFLLGLLVSKRKW
jgi:H+/Cl- antiporter ClcA